MRFLYYCCAAGAMVFLPGAITAQAGHEHEHAGPAPARLGRVVFPINCAPAARHDFARGVALLHSFWYEEAATTFHQVVRADTGCAMGYWGEAMTLVHPLWTPPTAADQERGRGLAHYLIHAYDSPVLASRGLPAAARYARIAPSVPHAQHMPSHIYVRVGRWEDAIGSNLRSAAAARAFEATQASGFWDQHGHALDYLVYAYLQEGRDRDAQAVVEEAAQVTTVFPDNSLINDYALAAIPARYALERNDWAAAELLTIRPAPAWRSTEAITHFARALGAGRLGHAERVSAEVDTLGQIEQALARSGGALAYWSGQVKIQRLAAGAWLALARGDTAEALRLSSSAADSEDHTEKHPVTPGAVLPARELHGDLLLACGRPAEARAAYEASLQRQPGRARSIFGAARAADLAGDRRGALAHYR
jgi:tetratricopeptide (TPR) repeat protein